MRLDPPQSMRGFIKLNPSELIDNVYVIETDMGLMLPLKRSDEDYVSVIQGLNRRVQFDIVAPQETKYKEVYIVRALPIFKD